MKRSKKKPSGKKAPKARTKNKAATEAKPPAQPAWQKERYQTLNEFWPFYLHEHAHAKNRLLHFIGTSCGLLFLIAAIVLQQYLLLLAALVSGYAFAWVGHFFIEKNRPATFTYPIKSFLSDWRMWFAMLTGRIQKEYQKYGIATRG